MMKTVTYQVSFVTPAFLGNAEQSGQWRTPPFKALLRQWWRVVWWNTCNNPTLTELRRTEGNLFGVAADNQRNLSSKSKVRIRLSRWDKGALKSWNGMEQGTVKHPEVQKTGYKVGPHAYLGYGPLDGRGGTKLGKNVDSVIQDGEHADLRLAFPEKYSTQLYAALGLLHFYGTIGGRSRNGWGSFNLQPLEGAPELSPSLAETFLQDWQTALELDWPHAIGRDGRGPLIWRTEAFDNWKQMMRQLAEIKIQLRTQFRFRNENPPHSSPLPRHWLSYPVTRHGTRAWPRNARLPNSLRFKVRQNASGQCYGVIFHVPCSPPREFNPAPYKADIQQVWQRVYGFLDDRNELRRSAV
ncbi:MAG: RAMP superfamily CRISPR-associated protein [Methylohalobius sp. ZOD2]